MERAWVQSFSAVCVWVSVYVFVSVCVSVYVCVSVRVLLRCALVRVWLLSVNLVLWTMSKWTQGEQRKSSPPSFNTLLCLGQGWG